MPLVSKFGKNMIRMATRQDLPAIMALDQSSNSHPWSEAWWLSALLNDYVALIQNIEQQIIAVIVWQVLLDEIELHLIVTNIYHRRKGMARDLMNYLFSFAQEKKIHRILLEVRVGNDAAQQLYLQCGFIKLAVRKGYYRDGEDALIMEKLC